MEAGTEQAGTEQAGRYAVDAQTDGSIPCDAAISAPILAAAVGRSVPPRIKAAAAQLNRESFRRRQCWTVVDEAASWVQAGVRGMHGRKRARLRVSAAVYIQAVARGRIARIEVAAKRSMADEREKTQQQQQRSYLLDEEESARRAAAAELERERERAALAAQMHELHEPEGQRARAAAERPREQAEQASSGDEAADAEPQPPSSSGSSRRRKQKGKEAADHARGRLEAAAAGGKAKRQEQSLIPKHLRHRVFETDATTHNQAFSLHYTPGEMAQHRTAPPAAVRSDATGHLMLGFANAADRTHEHGGALQPVADPCVGRWGLGRPREPARNRRAKLMRRGLDEARTRVFAQACNAAADAHSARTRLHAASRPRPYAAR